MNVRLLEITTGEEVVAEVVSEDDKTITVKNGLVVIPNQEVMDLVMGNSN